MNSYLAQTIKKTFVTLIQDLKDKKEIESFFSDFLGKEEFENLTKRLAIAYWIKKGRDNQNIKTNLNSTDKEIKEIKTTLNSPGMKIALKYMEAEEWANVWSEKIKKLVK